MSYLDAIRAYHKQQSHAVQAVYDHGHIDGRIQAIDDVLPAMAREMEAWTGEGLDACRRMRAIVHEYQSKLIVERDRANDPDGESTDA